MSKILIAAFAAVLGLASVSAFAKEVQLNDQERAELRQRAEQIQQQGMTGRSTDMRTQDRAIHRTAVKAKKAKHQKKASREALAKQTASVASTRKTTCSAAPWTGNHRGPGQPFDPFFFIPASAWRAPLIFSSRS